MSTVEYYFPFESFFFIVVGLVWSPEPFCFQFNFSVFFFQLNFPKTHIYTGNEKKIKIPFALSEMIYSLLLFKTLVLQLRNYGNIEITSGSARANVARDSKDTYNTQTRAKQTKQAQFQGELKASGFDDGTRYNLLCFFLLLLLLPLLILLLLSLLLVLFFPLASYVSTLLTGCVCVYVYVCIISVCVSRFVLWNCECFFLLFFIIFFFSFFFFVFYSCFALLLLTKYRIMFFCNIFMYVFL